MSEDTTPKLSTEELLRIAQGKRRACRRRIMKELKELEDHNGFIGYLIKQRKLEQLEQKKAS